MKIENEIFDTKTGDCYKITRGFFGGLKLKKTWNGNNPYVTKMGTSGIMFNEKHIDTKLLHITEEEREKTINEILSLHPNKKEESK